MTRKKSSRFLVLVLLSLSLVSLTTAQSVTESTLVEAADNTQPQTQPITAQTETETDQAIADEYAAKAERLYVNALTDYYATHPDHLSADLSELTSAEYESIPADFLDSLHIDQAAVEAQVQRNDQQLMHQLDMDIDTDAEAEVDVDLEDQHEISQRGGGSGIDPSSLRGRRFGGRRRCYYVLVGSSGGGGGGGGGGLRSRGRPRRRLRCPSGVIISGGRDRDRTEQDDDMGSGDGDGGILWIRLRRLRRLIRMMRRLGMTRSEGMRGGRGGGGGGGGGGRGRGGRGIPRRRGRGGGRGGRARARGRGRGTGATTAAAAVDEL